MSIKALLRGPYRWLLLRWHRIPCAGRDVYVHPLVRVERPAGITLSDDVQVRWSCELLCGPHGQIQIGAHSRIDHHVTLEAKDGYVRLGHSVYVGSFSILRGDGGLEVGNDVLISPQVIVISANHAYADCTRPIREQGEVCKGVRIADDVWIGSGAKILDGVAIGCGTVVGAGAVVTRDLPPYSLAAGIPARVIRQRHPLSDL